MKESEWEESMSESWKTTTPTLLTPASCETLFEPSGQRRIFYSSLFLCCKMAWWMGQKTICKLNRNWLYAQGKHAPSHHYSFLIANIKAKLSVRAVISHRMRSRLWLCRSRSCCGWSLVLVWTCLYEFLPYCLSQNKPLNKVGKKKYNFIYQVPQVFSCSGLRGYFLLTLWIFTQWWHPEEKISSSNI